MTGHTKGATVFSNLDSAVLELMGSNATERDSDLMVKLLVERGLVDVSQWREDLTRIDDTTWSALVAEVIAQTDREDAIEPVMP